MKLVNDHLQYQLDARAKNGNLRQLSVANPKHIDFFSNDYLGWATQGILASAIATHPTYTGATGSRSLSGNNHEVEQLEDIAAAYHQTEAAVLFNSGYDANIGLLSALGGRHSIFIYDELCHASIIDGVRLGISRGKYSFDHNNCQHLKELLEKHSGSGNICYVIVESIYSMDGDSAPLKEIISICQQYDAALIVDEAHATGVWGTKGGGLCVAAGIENETFARVHTFGKALGCHGAMVVGSTVLKNYLVNFARSFIYTTALPPHSIATIKAVYQLLEAPDFSNAELHGTIQHFVNVFSNAPIAGCTPLNSTIQTLITRSNETNTVIETAFKNVGIAAKAIRWPTVAKGSERIRICLHAYNTKQDIELLHQTLHAVLHK